MKIRLLAVGSRMPDWVEAGVEEYARRLPRDFRFEIREIPLVRRGKNADTARAVQQEGEAMLAALQRDERAIALDVKGRTLSTETMAQQLGSLRDEGVDLALLVGGPDGLAPSCLARAAASWSLSSLTLPHPLVRVLVAEQVYRAWSWLSGHPYHRAG